MVASVASFDSPDLVQARAVVAAADAAVLRDRSQHSAPQPAASTEDLAPAATGPGDPSRRCATAHAAPALAFAPAAMAALIEAQESLSREAPVLAPQETVARTDCAPPRLADGPTITPATTDESAAALRRLEAARVRIRQTFSLY